MTVPSTWLDRTLWPAVALLGVTILIFQFTDADVAVQDHLYDFENRRWLVDRFAWWPSFVFHKLPKYLIIAWGLLLIVRAFVVPRWKKLSFLRPAPVREALVVLGCLALTPITVSLGKELTNVFCPWDVDRYGGKEIYLKTWTRYGDANRPEECGNCWPAGHAAGGFALVSLASLAVSRRGRIKGVFFGLIVGWIMGGYQMLKGAHYISDTLVTMLLAWIIHLVLRRALLRGGSASAS